MPAILHGPRTGRFAPSPTGPLHFGSLVAALGSFLEARRVGGRWLLRIEDLDTPRVVPGAADAILHSLERFALRWDGPVLYQSQRLEHYAAALERLRRLDRLYPCTCSRRHLARHSPQGPGGPIYPGHCRFGPRRPSRQPALRVRTECAPIGFHDRIQGPHAQNLEAEVGDFVVRRADGLFAYQLAVVVDDAWQGVTDVIRGSDLLDSTPRQIWLQRLLDLPTPDYAHLPVAVDGRGRKLSKQTHAPEVDQRRPGATLVEALRFLGQTPEPELARSDAGRVLEWARVHWNPLRIPCRRAIPWPPGRARSTPSTPSSGAGLPVSYSRQPTDSDSGNDH